MVTLMVTFIGNTTYFIHKQRRPRPNQGCRAMTMMQKQMFHHVVMNLTFRASKYSGQTCRIKNEPHFSRWMSKYVGLLPCVGSDPNVAFAFDRAETGISCLELCTINSQQTFWYFKCEDGRRYWREGVTSRLFTLMMG